MNFQRPASLSRTTITLTALTLVSNVLGVGREMAIAWRYGASAQSDVFFVVFSIPFAFYSIVGVALTAAIVPMLSEFDAKGRHQEGMRAAATAMNLIVLCAGAAALAGMAAAPQVAWIMGGDFRPDVLLYASEFTRIVMPSIVFMSVAGVLGGVLNTRNVFVSPAVAPLVMNLVIIAFTFVGSGWFGVRIMVMGTLAGSALFVLVQFPSLIAIRYRHSWNLSFKDPLVRELTQIIWPVMLLSVSYYVYRVIDYRLASGLPSGSIAALNYAMKFIQLPQGLFVIAVTTAIFPTLSALNANGRREEMIALLRKGLRFILVLAVPGAVGLVVLCHPIMSVLFQRGAFSAHATQTASGALAWLGVGLVGFCLNLPLIRGFYALHDRLTPLYIAAGSILLKLALGLLLIGPMQVNGLAVATSITYLVNAAVMIWLLDRRLPGLVDHGMLAFLSALSGAALVLGAVAFGVDAALSFWLGTSQTAMIVRLVAASAAGAAAFVQTASVLGVRDVREAIERLFGVVTSRLRPKAAIACHASMPDEGGDDVR